MHQIKHITAYLETIAPLALQESYDNAGLIAGDKEWEVKGILFCLDSIESVIEEAVQKNCNLVIAHHPIVFRGLKSIGRGNYIERTIVKAIKQDVAIYAIHTNLDNVLQNGVNQRIAQVLGLNNLAILAPKQANDPQVGSGVIGQLPEPMDEQSFLAQVKQQMKTACIRHTKLLDRPIERVAICGGSGSFLLKAAIQQKAQVYISADFKYHEFFDANQQIVIADIGHYESEQYTIDLLYELVEKTFAGVILNKTGVNTNPIEYFT